MGKEMKVKQINDLLFKGNVMGYVVQNYRSIK
jgi:hypothetical protein